MTDDSYLGPWLHMGENKKGLSSMMVMECFSCFHVAKPEMYLADFVLRTSGKLLPYMVHNCFISTS